MGTYLSVDSKILAVVRGVYVIVTDLAISLVLTTLGNKRKKFNFVHQTISRWEARSEIETATQICSEIQ